MIFWRAMRAGEILSDPARWKERQNLINALSAIIGALLWLLARSGIVIDLSAEDIAAVAGGLAVALGAVNGYLTTATTKKIGVKPKEQIGQGD